MPASKAKNLRCALSMPSMPELCQGINFTLEQKYIHNVLNGFISQIINLNETPNIDIHTWYVRSFIRDLNETI